MKTVVIHVVAWCETCGKEWQNYLTAQKQASNHAYKTGHYVVVETGAVKEYNSPKSR
jgi:hypothetical protein